MQQKYQVPFYTVTNLTFKVENKQPKARPKTSRPVQSIKKPEQPQPSSNFKLNSFIPSLLANPKKQLIVEYNTIKRKQMKPISPRIPEKKGFPSRKIKSSQSYRSLPRQKNFNFEHRDPSTYFSNKLISQSVSPSKLSQSQPTQMTRSMSSGAYSAKKRSYSQFKVNTFQFN